jgi:hypothetical protein
VAVVVAYVLSARFTPSAAPAAGTPPAQGTPPAGAGAGEDGPAPAVSRSA